MGGSTIRMLCGYVKMVRRKLALWGCPPYVTSMFETPVVPTRFRLRALLAAHDPPMSQSEIARRSGVSLVTVNAIANNRTTRVDLETLDALCRVLKVDPGELLERVPDKRKRG